MKPLRLLPEARVEFDEGADWYETKEPSLGLDFVARVREVLVRIAARPQIHPVIYRDVRKAVVSRFPYVVLYREDAGEVLVISVFHGARDPSIWKSRI